MTDYVTDLNQHDLLLVQGPDSERFLQGQLTCDMRHVTPGQFARGALCNNKGRVICTFNIFSLQEQQYLLELGPGMAEVLVTHLGRYSVFYKTDMQPAPEGYRLFGYSGDSLEQLLAPETLTAQSPGSVQSTKHFTFLQQFNHTPYARRAVLLFTEPDSPAEARLAEMPARDEAWWLSHDHPWGFRLLETGQSGLYTPEELNLDLLGAVSFDKGCYTGQEVVARMHYKGKGKKRLYNFAVTTEDLPDLSAPDEIILTDSDGRVTLKPVFPLLFSEGLLFGHVSTTQETASNINRIRLAENLELEVELAPCRAEGQEDTH